MQKEIGFSGKIMFTKAYYPELSETERNGCLIVPAPSTVTF
jgi:hypothetical protein